MSALLWDRATYLGQALLPGRLYDLGSYPGLVADAAATTLVYGHLARLNEATAVDTWRTLDAYEGIELEDPEYERVLFHPSVPPAGYVSIWIYHYRHPVTADTWISSGDFRSFFPR